MYISIHSKSSTYGSTDKEEHTNVDTRNTNEKLDSVSRTEVSNNLPTHLPKPFKLLLASHSIRVDIWEHQGASRC